MRVERTFPLICSPLGFAPKGDGGLRKIHHLSFPKDNSVNSHISTDSAYLQYVAFERVLQMVLTAGRGCTIFRRDMSDAFRVVPIAPSQYWLLGFHWEGIHYVEKVLPFGLSTAPFIFNLFAEAWHWILQSYGVWELLEHFLDDSMAAIAAVKSTPEELRRVCSVYNNLSAQ